MKKSTIRIVSVLLALVLMLTSLAGCGNKEPEAPEESTSTTAPVTESTTEADVVPENVNPLTGLADLTENEEGSRPVAIVVENSPAARPQWGLSTPDIVIEGVAEGGITRMLWVYADKAKIPYRVGPTRSARHDFVELAKGMDAFFVHWGGSNGSKVGLTLGYQTIKNLGVNNIDQMTNAGSFFTRDSSRAAPHNGIISGDSIKSAIIKMGYRTKTVSNDWRPYGVAVGGKNPTSISTEACSEITVTFSTGFSHTFKYNSTDNKYYNYLGSKLMTDGNDGSPMAVENVITLYVPVSTLNTKEGHKEWNLEVTNGEGYYVSNGVGQKIYWSKAGKSAPLKIKDANNNELIINNGQVWMGFVPTANQSLTKVVG
jgi:predicted small lipoprotein YifL